MMHFRRAFASPSLALVVSSMLAGSFLTLSLQPSTEPSVRPPTTTPEQRDADKQQSKDATRERPVNRGGPVVAGGMPTAMVEMMVKGLKATPGCLGVEIAQLQSGKVAIIAWFKDKAAAKLWYASPAHRGLQQAMAGGYDPKREPMVDVPDNVPLMVVAAASPMPGVDGKPPSMQVGIEIYTPCKGGVRFQGGSFAPDAFRDLIAPPAAAAPSGGASKGNADEKK